MKNKHPIPNSVSSKISFSSSGFLISGTRRISFNHLWASLGSAKEILALVFVFYSTFDVHFFSKPHAVPRSKNNLALMAAGPGL